jgi:hypothetical protein
MDGMEVKVKRGGRIVYLDFSFCSACERRRRVSLPLPTLNVPKPRTLSPRSFHFLPD